MLEQGTRDERSRLLGVRDKWEQSLFLLAEVADGFRAEEAQEGSRLYRKIVVAGESQPPGGREGVMVVMRERDEIRTALHVSTLAAAVVATIGPRPGATDSGRAGDQDAAMAPAVI